MATKIPTQPATAEISPAQATSQLSAGEALGVLLLLVPLGLTLLLAPEADEGLWLVQAKLMTQGWVPYRDFVQFLWPGLLYGTAGLFSLSGPSVMAARAVTLALMGSAVWASLQLVKPWLSPSLRRWWVAYAVLGVLCNAYILSHHAWSGAFAVWSVYFLARAFRSGAMRDTSLSGLLAGLALVTTQSLGALLLVGLGGVCLYRFRLRQTAWTWLGGFLLPPAAMLAALGIQEALEPWFRQTVVWLAQGHYAKASLIGYATTVFSGMMHSAFTWTGNTPTGIRWPLWPGAMQLFLLAWLPVLGILGGLQWLITNKNSKTPHWWTVLTLTVAGALLLLGTFSYSTPYHLATNGWLGTALAMALVQRWLPKAPTWRKTVMLTLWLYVSSLWLIRTVPLGLAWLSPDMQLPSHGTVEPWLVGTQPPQQTRDTALLAEALHQATQANQPVFVFATSPQLYLLADRQPAVPWLWLMPGFTSPMEARAIVQRLQTHPPCFAVHDYLDELGLQQDSRFTKLPESDRKTLEPIHAWLARHYTGIPVGRHWRLYQVRPATFPQAMDPRNRFIDCKMMIKQP